jgi:hypothetical protein
LEVRNLEGEPSQTTEVEQDNMEAVIPPQKTEYEQEKWETIGRINLKLDKIEKEWQEFSFAYPHLISTKDLYHDCYSLLWELSNLRAAKKDWWNDEDITGTFADVLTELTPDKPIGSAEKSLWFFSPTTFFVPIALCVSILVLLAQLEKWLTLIIGFAGVAISGISISNNNGTVPNTATTISSNILFATQILGIITGILTAAKGVDLEKDKKFLVRNVEDLTVRVLEASYGKIDSNTVFQRGSDLFNSNQRFSMMLEKKKDDVHIIHSLLIFFFVATSTGIAGNPQAFKWINDRYRQVRLLEQILVNPHNYLTLQDFLDGKEHRFSWCGKKDKLTSLVPVDAITELQSWMQLLSFNRCISRLILQADFIK